LGCVQNGVCAVRQRYKTPVCAVRKMYGNGTLCGAEKGQNRGVCAVRDLYKLNACYGVGAILSAVLNLSGAGERKVQ
jgi:hypothetical protein